MMEFYSPDFKHDQPIPSHFTCDGDDMSPTLEWQSAPPETKSFSIIIEDPDAPAGTWIHWVIFNIPSTCSSLQTAMPNQEISFSAGIQGLNSWNRVGYNGPCPPSGTHHYIFFLFALDCMLPLKKGARAEAVKNAMQGHILAEAQLVGLYGRLR